jgi:hypothetical protein
MGKAPRVGQAALAQPKNLAAFTSRAPLEFREVIRAGSHGS